MNEKIIEPGRIQEKREEKEKKEEKRKDSESAIDRVQHKVENMVYMMQQNMLNDAEINLEEGELKDVKESFRELAKYNALALFNPEADLPQTTKQVMANLDKDIDKVLGPDISEAEKNIIVQLAFDNVLNSEYAQSVSPDFVGGLAEEKAAEEEERRKYKKAA